MKIVVLNRQSLYYDAGQTKKLSVSTSLDAVATQAVDTQQDKETHIKAERNDKNAVATTGMAWKRPTAASCRSTVWDRIHADLQRLPC